MTAATHLRRSCSGIWRNAGVRVVGSAARLSDFGEGKAEYCFFSSFLTGGATSCLESAAVEEAPRPESGLMPRSEALPFCFTKCSPMSSWGHSLTRHLPFIATLWEMPSAPCGAVAAAGASLGAGWGCSVPGEGGGLMWDLTQLQAGCFC